MGWGGSSGGMAKASSSKIRTQMAETTKDERSRSDSLRVSDDAHNAYAYARPGLWPRPEDMLGCSDKAAPLSGQKKGVVPSPQFATTYIVRPGMYTAR